MHVPRQQNWFTLCNTLHDSQHATDTMCVQVVELKPDWGKGYSRLGGAYHGLQKLDEAIGAYEKGQAHINPL